MGGCGSTIAAALAKALNYDYVDRQTMVNAAEASVLDAAIAEAAERRLSAWQRFNEEKIRYRIIAPFEVRVERIWWRRLPHTLDLLRRRHQPTWSGI